MTKHISVLAAAAALLGMGLQPAARQAPAPPAPAAPAAAEPAAPMGGDVARGRYIVEHVAMCVECHSTRDSLGQIMPGMRYMGGPLPPGPAWAADWATRAPRNAGLPGYTDEMAMRLLTQGAIGRLGEQLKMPMPRFRMTTQDAADVIAFMRTVP